MTRKLTDLEQRSVALAAWFESQEMDAVQSLIVTSHYLQAVIHGISIKFGKDPEVGIDILCEDMKAHLRKELKR
jgi:hypothetical protein